MGFLKNHLLIGIQGHTRACFYYKSNEVETWQTIKKLVASSDPDDNGTALTLFESTGDARGLELAQDWLNDGVDPATQSKRLIS